MESIRKITAGLESSFDRLEREGMLPKNKTAIAVNVSAVVFCTAVAVVSVLFFPKWLSIVLMALMAAAGIYGFTIINKGICRTGATAVRDHIIRLKGAAAHADGLSEKADAQTRKIESLESAISSLKQQMMDLQFDCQYYKCGFDGLVSSAQYLDRAVARFGGDCAECVREELSNALRGCSLRFVDYSEETARYYRVEPASGVKNVSVKRRAIVSEDGRYVLEGGAFVPAEEVVNDAII